MASGLLDELALRIHTIEVGRCRRLFEDTPQHLLDLVHHEVFKSSVLGLRYVPATS